MRADALPHVHSLRRAGRIDGSGFPLHFVVGPAAAGVVALFGLLRAEALRARFAGAHVAAGGMLAFALGALVARAVAAAAAVALVAHEDDVRKRHAFLSIAICPA